MAAQTVFICRTVRFLSNPATPGIPIPKCVLLFTLLSLSIQANFYSRPYNTLFKNIYTIFKHFVLIFTVLYQDGLINNVIIFSIVSAYTWNVSYEQFASIQKSCRHPAMSRTAVPIHAPAKLLSQDTRPEQFRSCRHS